MNFYATGFMGYVVFLIFVYGLASLCLDAWPHIQPLIQKVIS